MITLDLSKANPNSIVDIAHVIQMAIVKYQESLPIDKIQMSEGETTKFAIGQVMKLGKGRFNPLIISNMVDMERSVWHGMTMLQC